MWVLLLCSLATAQVCDDECSKILGSVNEERRLIGAGPVCVNAMLMRAAMVQAAHQHTINDMTHTGAGGTNIGDRVTTAGYKWTQASENVAMGQTTPKSVMLGWMNSEGHRKNILNPASTEMGIAHVGQFWAQAFGKPRPGTEACNVGVPGGSTGIVEAKRTDSGPACDSMCQSVLQVVNVKRASKGMAPLCISGKLQAAAASLALARSLHRLQEEVDGTGFGTKGVGAAEHTIRLSRGLPSDKNILDMLNKDYQGSGNGKDFTRGGIATDSRREFWVIIEAATYTPSDDKCDTGKTANPFVAAVAPPVPKTPVPKTPVVPPAATNCSRFTTACKCTGRCGWSTGSGSCLLASATVFTDCNECASQAKCPPQCSSYLTPCQCTVSGCGWLGTTRQCTAGAQTDCTECPTKAGCDASAGRTL
jgi:uncharacterized protein YkwD